MQKLDNNIFIKKSKKIHGDFYDYSLVQYEHSLKKVKIKCPEHGLFEIKPSNHINNKQGCYFCGKNKAINSQRKGLTVFFK